MKGASSDDFRTSKDVPAVPGAYSVKEAVVNIYSPLMDSQREGSQTPESLQHLARIIKEIFPSVAIERVERELRTGKAPDVILNELAEESSRSLGHSKHLKSQSSHTFLFLRSQLLERQRSPPRDQRNW